MADEPETRDRERGREHGRGSRHQRWLGLCRLSLDRLAARLRRHPRRTGVTVSLVALTIALLLVVTGIAVGLAGESTTDESEIRVVPEGGGTLSSVIDVEGPRLGDTHGRTATIDDRDDVAHATPILTELVRLRTADGETETALALGVVPPAKPTEIEGVSTAGLEPGDPHFANGSFDGPRTDEIVVTDAVANDLNATAADDIAIGSPRSQLSGAGGQQRQAEDEADENRSRTPAGVRTVTVTAVDDTETTDLAGELPLVVVHLSELQTLTGADDGDLADQVLVEAGSDASTGTVEAAAEDAYPNATVRAGGDGGVASIRSDDLALATSLVALVVAVAICSLFVATAAALTIERDRRTIAALAAVGFSLRSRLAVVALTTLGLTLAGALAGVGLGVVGIAVTNRVATATVAPEPIAALRPVLAPYAVGVALIAGVLALPYPLYLVARTNVVAELGR